MKKILEGIVVSTKMKDTIVVEVTRKAPHPMYRKIIKRTKKYKVSPAGQDVNVGDTVKIAQTRPISGNKHFKVVEVKK